MKDALKVVPSTSHVSTGVRDTDAIAKALSGVLADTYRLVFKTHAYHWNVEGPLFYSIHKLTEEQYENMFTAADELAERIRALGELAPSTMAQIMDMSKISDKGAVVFRLPMTRSDIADFLGLTIETVSRNLTALKNEGVIDLPQTNLVRVRDIDRLRDKTLQEHD